MSRRDGAKRSSSGGRGRGAGPPPRRGFLDGIFAPRPPVASPMPSLRSSFVRGLATAWSTPWSTVGVAAVLGLLWLAFVALGFQGPFALFVNVFALPPVGTLTDVTFAGDLAAAGLVGLLAIAGAVVVRGVLLALVVSAAVTGLRSGRVTRWSAVSALRALPATLAVSVLSLTLLLVQSIVGAFLGGAGGFGLLIFFGGLVLGISYLGFAPTIALTERRRLGEVLQRSVRAARMPGSGNLTLALLYVVPSYAMLVGPGKPGGDIGVNPSIGAWVLVVVVNLLHVAVTAAYAYRYLAVADAVPDAPPPRRS